MTEIGSPVAQAPAPTSGEASQFDSTAARKQSTVIMRRFLRHKAAVFGLVLFVILALFAFLGGAIWKYSYTDLSFRRYLPPSLDHPFGTDRLGGDMVAQLIRGTQFSLQIALVVAVLSTVIGVVLGALAGYLKGWVDTVISRFIDLLLVIPSLVIAAVLVRNSFVVSVAGNGGSSNWMIVALYLGLIGWLSIARVIRGMVLSLREKEFVEAARALGASTFRIVFRHILPNTVDVIIVNATLAIAQAVLLEAALSFIGLGVQSPDTSLGLMISQNKNELTLHPWLFLATFVFIVLISLSVNFIGDGLRDAFDPRQKRVKA
ncbi:ABC transporter permease [Actinosynnema sp. NPDC047251]|uniref:Oligopeptide transport system permease protein OppC n=1 Tax=Saccharothrix espanaensis (strain ATCC 51144 / DSM 44229 / JCM 9112 / NBRC 15066 / NRRL 15764) TaxID=1179773 RepID=K0JRW4_SACES|nr:ABC transporter permease [Saccharothrix espanaensis]CCH28177.1 ABC-type transporter, permease subunit [Saccharothrix espanaensis DSM 44229]